MDPFVPLPEYTPPGRVYSGPPPPRGEGPDEAAIRAIINEELSREIGIVKTEQTTEIKKLKEELRQMKAKAEAERIGSQAAQDKLKEDMFNQGVTPVPPQEQLTANERDQLDFFLKSPGIGMCFLSVAFFIAKTDLGTAVKSAAQNALGDDMIGTVDDGIKGIQGVAQVRKLSISAMNKATETKDENLIRSAKEKQEEEEGFVNKLLKPGKIGLTIIMPLLILGVQFAYIFFIFKEGFDSYSSGVCPGYDVPKNLRYDPGWGADTQVRILVGFVGAYFVFKNISQLISYQRALKGNPHKPITAAPVKEAVKGVVHNTATFVTAGAQSLQHAAQSAVGGAKGQGVGVSGTSMGIQHDHEGSLKMADTSTWKIQDVTLSYMYRFYCLDVFFNLTLVFFVLLCNLYVVFVTGAGAQDVVTKVVILDFILLQQTNFKREIFSGTSGRVVLQALKEAFEYKEQSAALTRKNEILHDTFARILLLVGQLPIFVSLAFIMYGPICKPGIDKLASIAIKNGGK